MVVLCIQAEAGAVIFNHASPLRQNPSLDFRLHHEVAELASWWFSASRPKQEPPSAITHHHCAETLPWTFACIMRLPNLLHGGSLHPGRSRSCHLQPCLTTTPKHFPGLLLACGCRTCFMVVLCIQAEAGSVVFHNATPTCRKLGFAIMFCLCNFCSINCSIQAKAGSLSAQLVNVRDSHLVAGLA